MGTPTKSVVAYSKVDLPIKCQKQYSVELDNLVVARTPKDHYKLRYRVSILNDCWHSNQMF
jgi:hypothetical protein